MLEAYIHSLYTEDPGRETPAETRERLKDLFPRNASRRMTQLGQLVGAVLGRIGPCENEPIVYATAYGETRALESYLESFPAPSPTLFQTSIHPSGVQQALIARQQPIRELFPMTGSDCLTARALEVALLTGASKTLFCGGEERGTWMLDNGAASERTFAFALVLSADPTGAAGHLALTAGEAAFSRSHEPPTATAATRGLSPFFDLLHMRQAFSGLIAPERTLTLAWL